MPVEPQLAHETRLRALRAIMDGRGVDALVLRDPALVAHYGGAAAGAVLVVRAAEALLVGAPGDTLPRAGLPAKGFLPPRLRAVGTLDEALAGARRVGSDGDATLGAIIRRQAGANP